MLKKTYTIALLGNPNAGKSSLFNHLTGLRQQTGNFPGVTVEKKIGSCTINGELVKILDLPGTYSLYPNAQDERVVVHVLCNSDAENYPDAIIYVADVTALDRHLLLATQVLDLGIPVVMAMTMSDTASEKGVSVDMSLLANRLKTPIVTVNGRTGEGIEQLKEVSGKMLLQTKLPVRSPLFKPFYQLSPLELGISRKVREVLPNLKSDYSALLTAQHATHLPHLSRESRNQIFEMLGTEAFEPLRWQIHETLLRYQVLDPLVRDAMTRKEGQPDRFSDKLDSVLAHHVFGVFIFIGLMFLVFQSVFSWATAPMDWIESGCGQLSNLILAISPDAWWTDLLGKGIVSGLSGILVFIPQIFILFLLLTILEEVGYMSRAVYLFDRIMQRFGLNGRSIVAMVAGGACAIPAVMSTRTISNYKERLLTIMVTPLISCSARIPVYTLLVGFLVDKELKWFGFGAQGLVFTALYALSIVSALVVALVFKFFIRSADQTFLMIELPDYRLPHWRNVFRTVYDKVSSFVFQAGKVILLISVVLWAMARFGPGHQIADAKQKALVIAEAQQLDSIQTLDLVSANVLEASYAGHLGKFIEPAIRPLGFDWKIGIALVTSFAAREVFVGTMATIYSVGSTKEDNHEPIRERMKRDVSIDGKPVFTLATVLSLLIFYVFAMQCMSTIAVVKKETKSWKWPIIQLAYMTFLAYGSAFLVYHIFS